MNIFLILLIFLFVISALLLASCSHKTAFQKSVIVPSAEGKVNEKKVIKTTMQLT